MIPIENSVAGRVADIHHLLPNADLHIVGEHFLRVRSSSWPARRQDRTDHRRLQPHSCARAMPQDHPPAGSQGACRRRYGRRCATGHGMGRSHACGLCAATRCLRLWAGHPCRGRRGREAQHHTLCRASGKPDDAKAGNEPVVTTFIFRVRNVPAALYKAMGGFATNGVNMTKLESYQLDGRFVATMFYADIEGHPDDPPVARALEELSFFSSELKISAPTRVPLSRRSQQVRQRDLKPIAWRPRRTAGRYLWTFWGHWRVFCGYRRWAGYRRPGIHIASLPQHVAGRATA